MSKWVRLLRRLCVAAAVLAIAAVFFSRYGLVFIGGWSMAPTYTPGDIVVYRKTPVRVRIGDPVLVGGRGDRRAFVHRVIGIDVEGGLRTKGDANDTEDRDASDPADVVGVVNVAMHTGRAMHSVVRGVRWCYNHVPIVNTRR